VCSAPKTNAKKAERKGKLNRPEKALKPWAAAAAKFEVVGRRRCRAEENAAVIGGKWRRPQAAARAQVGAVVVAPLGVSRAW